jgi:hypothetical protein
MKRGLAAGAGARVATVVLLVLFGWITPAGLNAATGPLAPFFGTYVGIAEVNDTDGGGHEQRDMDIVIEPYQDDGFRLHWVNVTLVDGRRDVKGVERRVQEVLFRPAPKGDFFVEVQAENLFRERAQMQPMQGDPVRWATVDDGDLIVYSFIVYDDGRYELQIYERFLTEDGLDLEFRRVVDGELVRQVIGTTVRADAKGSD